MFEIRLTPDNGMYTHEIYFNGKRITKVGYFDEEKGVTRIDDYIEFDLEQLARLRAVDFPDDFRFSIRTKRTYASKFNMFDFERKGNTITVEVFGNYSESMPENDWWIWNPKKYCATFYKLAKQKGFQVHQYWGTEHEDSYELLVILSFPCEKTIGHIFNATCKELITLLKDTEKVLFRQVSEASTS